MISETFKQFDNPTGKIPQLHNSLESFFFNLGHVFQTENFQAISYANRSNLQIFVRSTYETKTVNNNKKLTTESQK